MGHRAPDQGRQLTALPDPTTTGARSPGAFLTLDGIEKRYGATHANLAVSLSIAPGEVIGLIGANGAGKSSTLMCIAGHVAMKAGRMRFNGQDISKLGPRERVKLGGAQRANQQPVGCRSRLEGVYGGPLLRRARAAAEKHERAVQYFKRH